MTETQAAHLRLLTSLPVRTHYAKTPSEVMAKRVRQAEYIRRKQLRQGVASPLEVDGRIFESLTRAVKSLKVSTTTMYGMIDRGEARFIQASSGTQQSKRDCARKASAARRNTGRRGA